MSNRPNCPQPVSVPVSAYSQPAPCSTPITLGGDVIGYNYDNTVKKIQGIEVSPILPTAGQVLSYDSSGRWIPVSPTTFTTLSVANGSGLTLNGTQLDINCTALLNHCNLLTSTQAALTYLPITGGLITGALTVQGVSQLSSLTTTGTVAHQSLAGSGNRQVVVDSSGNLSAQALSNTVYDGVNLGSGGKSVFVQKNNSDIFEFRQLKSASASLTIQELSNELVFTSTGEANDAINLPGGEGIYTTKLGSTLQLKSIDAGDNVTVTSTSNNIVISVPNLGEVNDGQNLTASGSGVANVFKVKSGLNLTYRGLRAGSGISLVEGANDITINATDSQVLSYNTTSNMLSISNGNSIDLSSLATGITIADTSTVDLVLTGTTLSANVLLRVNGTAVSAPAGSTPTGYNLTSTDGSVTISNPSAGNVNLAVAGNGFSVDTASSGNATLQVRTNTENLLIVATLSANRDVFLSGTNAVAGNVLRLSTVGTNFGTFSINVKDSTNSNAIIVTSNIATSYEFRFDGTNWRQFA